MQGNGVLHPSAIFGMVTAKNLRHHIDPEAWQSVIPELKRVVRPIGLVCIIEHNPFNLLTRLAVFHCHSTKMRALSGQRRSTFPVGPLFS